MAIRHAVVTAAVSLCLAAPAVAQDIDYQVDNVSSFTVTEFYTSATTDEAWGEDLFATLDLAPGESATISIADGLATCDYDVLFVFNDGDELTDTVNICDLSSYTIQD